MRQFRSDREACGRFAVKREEARKLLAWKPKVWINQPGTEGWHKEFEARMQQESSQAEANLRNLDADLASLSDRFQADTTDCLRDLDWPDVQIESLTEEIVQADKHKKR